jgi:hypothetical protein
LRAYRIAQGARALFQFLQAGIGGRAQAGYFVVTGWTGDGDKESQRQRSSHRHEHEKAARQRTDKRHATAHRARSPPSSIVPLMMRNHARNAA